MQLCAHVALRLYGYVALFQNSQISNSEISKWSKLFEYILQVSRIIKISKFQRCKDFNVSNFQNQQASKFQKRKSPNENETCTNDTRNYKTYTVRFIKILGAHSCQHFPYLRCSDFQKLDPFEMIQDFLVVVGVLLHELKKAKS